MTEEINYKRAPITEALFDVQVVLPVSFDYKKFEQIHEKIKQEFTTKEISIFYETSIRVNKNKDPEYGTKGGANGFLFKSSDGKKIIQFRTNGYTFNKLKPYGNWENFSIEAKKYFQEYIIIAQPIKVKSLGLRYINRIDLPLPINDFKEYLKTVPEIGADIPQDMADFFMRLVVPETDHSSNMAIITLAIDKSALPSANILPLILDIDVFRRVDIKADDPQIAEIFETLRAFKNLIFEKSITDKIRDLIK